MTLDNNLRRMSRLRRGLVAIAVSSTLFLAACAADDARTYDIGPIFPLSTDKCSNYGGKTEGKGLMAHCWVTKSKCEQAVKDWHQSMQKGGVTDAIQFSCD